jgi:hypothetical protein
MLDRGTVVAGGLNLDLGIRYDWIEQAAQDWQAF